MIDETGIFLTHNELVQLNRIFKIIGEDNLRTHYFIKTDIEAVYEVMGKVCEAIEEMELDGAA
ncbi:hypothetical protein ACFO4O_04160 [Glaciecola siphonariae]|uniref:Uncharacterized protein n=1 Tax=Glaciecola siphonariae TaxID=521012 RepID=A0ABV9LS74_9ALTE